MADNAMSLSFSAGRDDVTGTLRCLSQYKHACFKLLRLALTAPRFDDEAVARMKQEQLTAILQAQQSPRSLANEALMAMAFDTHPYGQARNGTAKALLPCAADIRAHYQAMMARNNLHLAVVGDIDRAALRRLMRDIFAIAAASRLPKARQQLPCDKAR